MPSETRSEKKRRTAETETIEQAERRLGIEAFPPSYRAFLQSKQSPKDGSFGDMGGEFGCDWNEWLPPGKVDYVTNIPEAVELDECWDNSDYGEEITEEEHRDYGDEQDPCRYKHSYMRGCIMISTACAGTYFLNPAIVNEAGEWEAWHLASWLPGCARYKSFGDMLQKILELDAADDNDENNDASNNNEYGEYEDDEAEGEVEESGEVEP